ncbi:MAG: ATP-binding protein, partial [Anaerolineae bacterium]
ARPGHGLAWRVVETGRSLLLPAYASQPDALPQWVEAGVKGIIAVPVVTGEKRIGALGLFGLRLDKQFSRRDLVLAETVGRQAGIAIQNARLFEAGQVYAAELEQRVIERTAELTRAVRARDEFLANMSHELRTPLSSILLRTEMIQRGLYGPLTDKQISSLQTIDDAGRHLLSLINDILDIAKIEAGKVDLDIQPVSIQSVCRAGLQLVKQIALQKRIELASHLDPAVAAVRADSRRLKQMLVNLLSNALKFTPEGGQVGLDVTADAEQGMILFTVWDTGIGIAQADMDRLFRPFEQLDSGLARKYEGTGLGLALVRRLAELHQGSVTVDSRIGEGSRFTISLPWTLTNGVTVTAGLQEKDSSRSDVSEMPAPTLAATILLADDNETLVTGLSEFLSQQGYHVLVARNGLEAIERAGKEKPDLILMDAHMPVLDGLEATRRIRADAALAAVPIVALTALAMSGDQERILDAGANAYLSKPVTLSALITMIEELLSGRKSK